MKTRYRMSIFLLGALLILSLSSISRAQVIFQDNFDSQTNWTVTQPSSGGGGSWPASNFLLGWTGYYNGMSWRDAYSEYRCTGGIGYNNMYVNDYAGYPQVTSACRTGKCATFWQESCTVQFEDSDGQIGVQLSQEYPEIYIRYYVKFKPNFAWMTSIPGGHNDVAQMKMNHVWHYTGSGSMWSFFETNDTRPMWVMGLAYWAPGDQMQLYVLYRCETSPCNTGSPAMSGFTVGNEDYPLLGTLASMRAPGKLFDGNWHYIEQHAKLNTNSGSTFNANGIYEVWIDGVRVYGRTNVVWSKNGSPISPRSGFQYITFGGNNNNAWQSGGCSGSACEQWYAIDDVVVSTQYIGPGDTPPPVEAPSAPTGLRVQ